MIRVQVEKGKTKWLTDLPEDIVRPIFPAVVEKTSEGSPCFLTLTFFIHWKPKQVFLLFIPREDKGEREGIPHTHPIPWVIRHELFLESG